MTPYEDSLSYYPPLLYAAIRGIRWDRAGQEKLREEYLLLMERTYKELVECIGQDINVKSGPQIGRYIEGIGYTPKKTGKGNYKLEVNDLRELRRKAKAQHQKFFDLVILLRQQRDYYSKYVLMTPDVQDGRMRCAYNLAGTETWRISSSTSIFGCGSNFQNIPKKMDKDLRLRSLFLADEGHVMGAIDLSKAEVYVVAHLSGDEATLEILNNGRDIHTHNASLIFRIPYEEIAAGKKAGDPYYLRMRHLGKLVKHAVNYGMTWMGLLKNAMDEDIYLTAAEAKELIAMTKAASPLLEDWQSWVREKLYRDRKLTTPFGKTRTFGGELSGTAASRTFGEGYAFVPQSTVGQLTLRGMTRLFDAGFDFLLTVHDENVVQVPIEKVGSLWYARTLMEEDVPIQDMFGVERIMRIPAELSVGFNWGNLREIDDEKQLQSYS